MVFKMSPFPCSPFLQNFNILKFLYDKVFHQVHLMNMSFYRRGQCTKSFILIVWFYAFLFITFLKNYFRHLITLVYKTQNDIYIIFKIFLNTFINLRWHHLIYWHTTIHYNYNNTRFLKIQSCPSQSFFSYTLLFSTPIMNPNLLHSAHVN